RTMPPRGPSATSGAERNGSTSKPTPGGAPQAGAGAGGAAAAAAPEPEPEPEPCVGGIDGTGLSKSRPKSSRSNSGADGACAGAWTGPGDGNSCSGDSSSACGTTTWPAHVGQRTTWPALRRAMPSNWLQYAQRKRMGMGFDPTWSDSRRASHRAGPPRARVAALTFVFSRLVAAPSTVT